MEPFIVLAIAAALLVVFYVVWSKRSEQTETRPDDASQRADRDRGVNKLP